MAPSTALVFYLADPKTNAPRYVGTASHPVTDERDRLVKKARARGRDPVHKWIRSLRPVTPLLVTLPYTNAPVDEQLAVWHKIYDALDLLSQPPRVTAPAELVTKFEEWVDLTYHRYTPLKPVSERRTRHHIKPKPDVKPKAKPKPKPKPAARKRTSIFRCNSTPCDFLAKRAVMQRHQAAHSHHGLTYVFDDEQATIRDFNRQEATRKAETSSTIASSEIRRCAECDFLGKKGRLKTHHKVTGHGGETRLPQNDETMAAYEAAHPSRPESGLVRCAACGRLGRKPVIKNHQRLTGHDEVTVIYIDDTAAIAEYEANTKRGRTDPRYRCGECAMVTLSGALVRHQKKTGHTGRTRVKAA